MPEGLLCFSEPHRGLRLSSPPDLFFLGPSFELARRRTPLPCRRIESCVSASGEALNPRSRKTGSVRTGKMLRMDPFRLT